MEILSGLFRSRDAPKDSTAGSAYRFFRGGSSSGKQVNERSAMDYKGNVTVKIDGIAASAASVIAMAGTKVLVSPVFMLMMLG